ncbi:MAG: GNAT family N-acetyltransferase [Candidatus Hermodarchaeota archaeon]|nr:GNAT family N-acetyltransferase [Candidatus Hermodarchaeota archaeon]MDO8123062.1 GNAT family N-acetyltransferase [Candidatus Hermodarchaeota archaeon]
MQFIASTDPSIAAYQDQFLGLKTIFEETKFPYWILVDNQTVMGLIVAAKEPRDHLQPASTTFIQVYLFRHQQDAVAQLLATATQLAKDYNAGYLSCKVESDKQETIQQIEGAGFSLFDETIKMGVPLQEAPVPQTHLTFTRASPEETNQILENLSISMTDTPGRLLHTVVNNIQKLPSNQLDSILSQMEVILVKDATNTVGMLSLEGPTIGLLGVRPQDRGKGYGTTITQWAKSHLSEQGHFRAWLKVSVDNAPALHIFEKEGFKAAERTCLYVKTNPTLWQDPGL